MRLLISLMVITALFTASSSLATVPIPMTEPEVSAELLSLELEADRILMGPNFYMEDSYLVEGKILSINGNTITIEQHLDSPPHVVDPVITLHPYTLIQTRSLDNNYNLIAVDNAYYADASELLTPGQVIIFIYLTHNKTAKSIIIFK